MILRAAITRRALVIVAPLHIALMIIALMIGGCAHTPLALSALHDQCETVRRLPSMGTVFEIQTVTACTRPPAESLFVEIQAELGKMESEMSLYQPESPLSRLNRQGILPHPPEHLRRVLTESLAHTASTLGAFNVTVLPVVETIRESFRKSGRPPRGLSRLKPLLDPHAVEVTDEHIRFLRPSMKVSLDGIAKGYAVDRIAEKLEAAGLLNYLVNFSGNMRWRGKRPSGERWRIATWDPLRQRAIVFRAPEAGAIATSGSEHVSYSADQKWHHVIDPRTLRPASAFIAGTAQGPSAMICDILSKPMMILSVAETEQIQHHHYPEYHYWKLAHDGRVATDLEMTEGDVLK